MRIARVVVVGQPYHVTHRGNHRGRLFFDDAQRRRYLHLLALFARRYGLEIWGYCLMENHVHLLVVPRCVDSMARAIGNAHRAFSRLLNEENEWTGHAWANRFYSSLLDEFHLWIAIRYIELNPVRAKLVASAASYPWSSARAHARRVVDPILSPDRPFPGSIENWERWLEPGLPEADAERLRANTRVGRPTVSDARLAEIEIVTGRVLHRRLPGRRPRADAVPIAAPSAVDEVWTKE